MGTPMLKLSHGWPILTTDMLDTHMLPPPMVLTHMPVSMVLDTTVMLLEVIVTLERDLLTPTPMLKLSHGWPILTTDMLDTHMLPPPTVLTHMLVSMVLDTTVMLLE